MNINAIWNAFDARAAMAIGRRRPHRERKRTGAGVGMAGGGASFICFKEIEMESAVLLLSSSPDQCTHVGLVNMCMHVAHLLKWKVDELVIWKSKSRRIGIEWRCAHASSAQTHRLPPIRSTIEMCGIPLGTWTIFYSTDFLRCRAPLYRRRKRVNHSITAANSLHCKKGIRVNYIRNAIYTCSLNMIYKLSLAISLLQSATNKFFRFLIFSRFPKHIAIMVPEIFIPKRLLQRNLTAHHVDGVASMNAKQGISVPSESATLPTMTMTQITDKQTNTAYRAYLVICENGIYLWKFVYHFGCTGDERARKVQTINILCQKSRIKWDRHGKSEKERENGDDGGKWVWEDVQMVLIESVWAGSPITLAPTYCLRELPFTHSDATSMPHALHKMWIAISMRTLRARAATISTSRSGGRHSDDGVHSGGGARPLFWARCSALVNCFCQRNDSESRHSQKLTAHKRFTLRILSVISASTCRRRISPPLTISVAVQQTCWKIFNQIDLFDHKYAT